MTSNQFLTALGDPAEVEAEIGRTFERDGLQTAFDLITAKLLPLHERQELKRQRGLA
jgi:hypothetical protein